MHYFTSFAFSNTGNVNCGDARLIVIRFVVSSLIFSHLTYSTTLQVNYLNYGRNDATT